MGDETPIGIELIGHLGYVLLISASLVRSILPLRMLAVAAGTTSIIYGVLLQNRVDVIWESIFTTVNAVQAIILIREKYGIRLNDEEQLLRGAVFPHMSVLDFHRFIRAGAWRSHEAGVDLTVKGKSVDRIVLMSEGSADVVVDGAVVAHCRRGDFIGEIAFVTGNPATATVRTAEPSRCLSWDFAALRNLLQKHPELGTDLQGVLNKNLILKLNEQRERNATKIATAPSAT